MSYVPSWIVKGNSLFYLTDKDVVDYHNREKPGQQINWNDFTGHSGIRQIYPGLGGEEKEGFPCPKEMLKRLLSGKMKNICRNADNIHLWPVKMLPVLTMLSDDADACVRRAVAENPICSPELLTMLAADNDDNVRGAVAEHPNCSPEALNMMSNDDVYYVRRAVAENPNCSTGLLTILAADGNNSVREDAAGNPICSAEALAKLAADNNDYVRRAVAGNPNCSPRALDILANDDCSSVRRAVARNPICSEELLTMMANDNNNSVRRAVARNPICSAEALNMMSADYYNNVRVSVARHPNCLAELLAMMSDDDNHFVRCAVARNPKCPAETLTKLSADADAYVRLAVAEKASLLKKNQQSKTNNRGNETLGKSTRKIIKERRELLGITQAKLAELSGKKRPYISKLENGALDNPTWDMLVTVGKPLGLKPALVDVNESGEAQIIDVIRAFRTHFQKQDTATKEALQLLIEQIGKANDSFNKGVSATINEAFAGK